MTYQCLRLKKLVRSLETHEQRKKKKAEPFDQLLQMKGETQNTQGKERYRWGVGSGSCGKSQGQEEEKEQSDKENWHVRGQGPWRGGRSSNSNVECFKCGKYVHYAKDCYSTSV